MRGRIAFFSPRSVGQLGTPGHHKLFDEMRRQHEIRVFAPGPGELSVWWDPDLALVPTPANFPVAPAPEVLAAVRHFQPDILYFFAHANWASAFEAVRNECPLARSVLDVRTAPLTDNLERIAVTRAEGSRVVSYLNQIVTISRDAVGLWFQDPVPDSTLVPMGVDVTGIRSEVKFRSKDLRSSRDPWNLLYSASLHPKRKSELLLKGFASFLKSSHQEAVLNVVGSGSSLKRLIELAEELQISDAVCFHGLLEQKALFRMMEYMDAGIAWVPVEKYNSQPSLKSLEYMAAGLPVLATETRAHLDLHSQGFSVDYCEDRPESLVTGLMRWADQGFSADRVQQNMSQVNRHDFPVVVQSTILPILTRLMDHDYN